MSEFIKEIIEEGEDICLNEVKSARKETNCENCNKQILRGDSKFNMDYYLEEYSHISLCTHCVNKIKKHLDKQD